VILGLQLDQLTLPGAPVAGNEGGDATPGECAEGVERSDSAVSRAGTAHREYHLPTHPPALRRRTGNGARPTRGTGVCAAPAASEGSPPPAIRRAGRERVHGQRHEEARRAV
jgi:hypothetical protein